MQWIVITAGIVLSFTAHIKLLHRAEGVKGTDAAATVQASYDDDKTDEFVLPTVIEKDGKPVATISDKVRCILQLPSGPCRERSPRAFCDDDFGARNKDWIPHSYASQCDDTIQNKLVAFHKFFFTIPLVMPCSSRYDTGTYRRDRKYTCYILLQRWC